ncbi:hypothetical protein ACE41H_15530 [Paenibacillus enshidis]|uniref:Uncharacterized protein n=1 Tax=Paenibacillus enshidis TaxID=1458439 RepID=A0ABV5AVE8_9BACL
MNRKRSVERHHPVLTRMVQGTQSNCCWHYSGGHHVYDEQDVEYQQYEAYERKAGYPMKPGGCISLAVPESASDPAGAHLLSSASP